MIKDAMHYLVELGTSRITTVADRPYWTYGESPVLDPSPQPIHLRTLTGLLDWLEQADGATKFLHVVSESRVNALDKLAGQWNQRFHYAQADLMSYEKFPFDQYLQPEDFIVQLQCKFVADETQKKLIDYIGHIQQEQVTTAEDDGIAQEVTLKNKVGRLAKEKIEPTVWLHPYRTFREVEQPSSRFLLRLKNRDEGLPYAALFEADGGLWRHEAMLRVAAYLKEQLEARGLSEAISVVA